MSNKINAVYCSLMQVFYYLRPSRSSAKSLLVVKGKTVIIKYVKIPRWVYLSQDKLQNAAISMFMICITPFHQKNDMYYTIIISLQCMPSKLCPLWVSLPNLRHTFLSVFLTILNGFVLVLLISMSIF